ncbi:glycosyltransferase family 2 protein [Thermodesulforhabdus norvegica]|uniref:Glycosyltransferase involved in cell wall bisynthesis n=1 Tax=Thermodesulforhabdus norvegica TaxID=39841 RepID=A0A1I4U6A6_9BACT|nr:glycosyltransferase family 2 protein [Thermodesulforhabdus norvegica]SFM84518.1 Glycosyltransferase involved in cell wall bisynthesis [Thermodesulforhabdus norvegica]
MPESSIDISVVIPVYNEKDNLIPLTEALAGTLKQLNKSYEIVFVDDGSNDGSTDLLETIAQRYPFVRVVVLRRNYGQSAAFAAGINHARGNIIVTMDGDLQNDPQDIPRLISKLEEGFDVVHGWRKSRKDPLITRRLVSMVANFLIRSVTGVNVHDCGCSLRAYRRNAIDEINLYGDLHRFIPVLLSMEGAKSAEIVVNHNPRKKGQSKYGLSRAYRVFADLILMAFFQRFMTRPLHAFCLIGGALILTGFGICCYLSFQKIALGYDIGHRPLLLLGVLLILFGINLFTTGLLAEWIMRVYYEAQHKKPYRIRKILN